ncbi:organic cation transporter protein-like [Argiope bruennichi]|uniref:organic cation transporter protein-like n=1 Tax=Argiope bruennichi TaxID=94029 RepID=UPI002494D0FD|nr:organic cation transporter protein-like [Argiope bruennichi]
MLLFFFFRKINYFLAMSDKEDREELDQFHSIQITKNLRKNLKEEPLQKNEDILDIIGHDGVWQRWIFLWMIFSTIPIAQNYMAMSFYAPSQDFWCSRSEGSDFTEEEWENTSLPGEKHCFRFKNQSASFFMGCNGTILLNSDVIECDNWEYDTSFYSSTVLSQFDLVCEREWLISLSISVFNIGAILSNFIIGHLSDRLGRKPLLPACIIIQLCAGVACAFSTSFTMFATTRLIEAFALNGLFNVSFVLLMEIVGPKQRSFYGVAINLGWCVGFVCLPGVVWLLRDWFWIQLAITSPLVILLLTSRFIPESPRWLISQGKVKEAQKIVRKATETNGRHLSNIDSRLKVMVKTKQVNESKIESVSILDLFRTPGLCQMTLILYFTWFSGLFVYYGLSYNTNELAGDPFVNFALSGAIEFPAYFFTMYAIYWKGRKIPMSMTMGLGGLACLLTYPLPSDSWFSTTLSMIGKFCITIAVSIAYVFTAEIFPTPVRIIGLGSASICARGASVLAPFARELGHATNPVVPHILFGVLALLSGLLVMLLPETQGVTVPETLSEAASRRKPIWKKKIEIREYEMGKLLNDCNKNEESKVVA